MEEGKEIEGETRTSVQSAPLGRPIPSPDAVADVGLAVAVGRVRISINNNNKIVST